MSQTYQAYLSSLNREILNKDTDWGQHYDMESQIFINVVKPLAHPILAHPILAHPILAHQPEHDLESGLNKKLQNYATKQSNNNKCKCGFITSLIYIAHLVLFVMLFK